MHCVKGPVIIADDNSLICTSSSASLAFGTKHCSDSLTSLVFMSWCLVSIKKKDANIEFKACSDVAMF